jgi:hypothetical protein
MIKATLLILSLLFITSCGSNILIKSYDCKGNGEWRSTSKIGKHNFSIEKKIRNPLGFMSSSEVSIKELLGEEKIECRDLDNISIDLYKTPVDVISSFIPFFSSKTIKITGSYHIDFTDDL